MIDKVLQLEPRFITLLRGLALGFGLGLAFLLIIIARSGLGVMPANPIASYSTAILFAVLGILNWVWNPFTMRKAAYYYSLFAVGGVICSSFSFGFDTAAIYPAWATLFFVSYIFFGARAGFIYLAMIFSAGIWFIGFGGNLRAEGIIIFVLSILFEGFLLLLIIFTWRIAEERLRRLESSRKIEELEHSRLDALVNSMVDSVVAVNERGIVQMYNAATLGLFDTNKNLHRHHIQEFLNLYSKQGKKIDIMDLAVKSKIQGAIDTSLRHKFDDNDQISLSIKIAPISLSFPKKGKGGFAFIFSDITKAKSLEEEKDEFISVVSHELRTPIAIAEASVSNMQFLANKLQADKRIIDNLDQTHEQVLYLARMINDLSALSRAERTKLTDEEDIVINELLNELYKEYLPVAIKRQLQLNLDNQIGALSVKTSKLYTEEILQNFITNAIKYTSEGSVTIQAKRQEAHILISVKDTGPGISKSDQVKVFDKFYRSEDYRTRETGGTGLGLYVAQKLARKIGADITVESRLNHGTTFTLWVNYKK